MAKIDKFLELFHSLHESDYNKILKVFNTTRNFLKIVVKYGQQEDVDIAYIPENEWRNDRDLMAFLFDNGFIRGDVSQYEELEDNVKNRFLLWFLNYDEETALKFIARRLLNYDVSTEKDGYYLGLVKEEELSSFFESYSRDTSPMDLANAILGGDDFFERWWDTTDGVYRDVIDELNSANKTSLAEYILNEIGNKDLSLDDYDDDLFHEFSEEQGTENTFQITNSNIMNLIGDESAMYELLNGDLDDLKSELYSIHSNAYNGAYESECYNLVMDGLQEYFVGKFDWDQIKRSDGKIKYYPKIKIRDLSADVRKYLEVYIDYDYNYTLDYVDSYVRMMDQLFYDGEIDKIDFRIPDYPDYQLVDKYINEYFSDYI